MVGMRVHRTFVARLLADIKDAHILVIEEHFVMLRVDFRGVLRFRYDHGQDRHDDNWNEFFHNYNFLLVWKARRPSFSPNLVLGGQAETSLKTQRCESR